MKYKIILWVYGEEKHRHMVTDRVVVNSSGIEWDKGFVCMEMIRDFVVKVDR